MFKWEFLPATDRQIAYLEKQGIDTLGLTRGHATRLINSIARRNEANLSTVKQIRLLERLGYENVRDWPRAEASARIGELVRVGWKTSHLSMSPEQYNLMRFANSMFESED